MKVIVKLNQELREKITEDKLYLIYPWMKKVGNNKFVFFM